MDEQRARDLLDAVRSRVQGRLDDSAQSVADNRETQNQEEAADRAEPLTAEGVDDAVSVELRERLAAVERAEERLRDGSFGLSVLSGVPIPDERLEADPTAELTIEEARSNP